MWTKTSLVVALAVIAMAQQRPGRGGQPPAAAAAGTGTIAGKIVDAATGAPVKRAVVTVQGQTGGRTGRAMTGDDGGYAVGELAKGRYWITAEKTGYLRSGYRSRMAGGSGDPVELGDGAARTGIDIPLARQGVITGRVLDDAGEPAERVVVQALPVRSGSGRQGFLVTQTNDLGEFRLNRLPPGQYRLLASRPADRGEMLVQRTPGRPATAEAPTYFPGTVDAASAAPVQVNAGEERPGVEIRIQRSTVVNLSGRVAGEVPSGRGGRVAIRSTSEVSGFRGGPMMGGNDGAIAPDGSFTFRNVRPGEYVLTVLSMERGGPKMLGKATVAVGQQDVTGVTVNAAAAPKVDGRVRADGEPPFAFGRLEINLRGTGGGREFVPPSSARSDETGAFSFAAVSRERQALSVKTPEGVIVKEVYAAGQLLPGLDIDFSTVTGPLEIVLSNKPASITGTVEGTSAGAPRVAVWAVPDGEPLRVESWNTKVVRIPSESPAFTLDSLRPGIYRVAAFEDAESDAFNDAAVWDLVKAQTSTVKVGEGESAQVKLRLIPAKELEGR